MLNRPDDSRQMKDPIHARALSLVFALSIVVGGWLLFEYGNSTITQGHKPATPQREGSSQEQSESPVQKAGPAKTTDTPVPQNLAITYKCEKNGRIRYGDQPCGKDERTITVSTSERTNHPDRPLSQLQASVAQMEASRLERERKQAQIVQFSPASTSSHDGKELKCKHIDQEIAAIDSRLRQPYYAQTGDYFKGERKKLTDERFSLGC